MPDDPLPTLVTDGGIAAQLRGRVRLPLAVAPTTADAFNAIRPSLTPFVCFRLDDRRFAFDSSFVHPSAAQDLPGLFAMRPPSTPGAGLLAVFGHADPTGDDDYNKALSGRRATAVYALLTRRTDLWDELHEKPFKGDKWGVESIQTMLTQVGFDTGGVDGDAGPNTQAAIRSFQDSKGLTASGKADPPTRLALYAAYMDSLCGGATFLYAAGDFIDKGSTDNRRGAVQGCSDFNPVIVMSTEQQTAFQAPERHKERDAFNLSNRRVVLYVFKDDSHLSLDRWPCPSAKDPADGCKAAFWSDGDARRRPAANAREHRRGGKTFACKFYDTFGRLSPCEAARGTLRVFLHDQQHQRMPNVPYRLAVGGDVRKGKSKDEGFLLEENVLLAGRAVVSWGDSPWRFRIPFDSRNIRPEQFTPTELAGEHTDDDPAFYRFTTTLRLDIDDTRQDDDEAEFDRRLKNLGYRKDVPIATRVAEFRADYNVPDGDTFDPATKQSLFDVHRDGKEKAPPPTTNPTSDGAGEDGAGCFDINPANPTSR